MGFTTRPDFSRQIKQYSGTTAELSGSTRIRQNLDVLGSISGNTISGGTYYSGSTDLSTLIGSATNVQPGKNIATGGTVSDPVINLDDDVEINSVSATTLSASTIDGMGASNPYFYRTAGGGLETGINGVYINSANLRGTSLSATTFMDLQPQTSLPDPAPGRMFFSGGTLNAMMYCSGTTASAWVVMNKTGFI